MSSSRSKYVRTATSRPNITQARARKAPSIVTDVNAYDRTDPFTALNTLLKLLSSLSSRIGGCHLKLAPEEHKLSLHLLNIVEPFVGLAPSRRSITRQPTEILDAITFHVESPADLVSFGLTCKRLQGIVSPRHLHYRTIRCKLSSIRVWHHLATHRSLARNVRRLEVLDERSGVVEVIPPALMISDTDLESTDDELGLHAKHEKYLIAALTRMSALSSFTWSCNHSPTDTQALWPILRQCKTLTTVEISDNSVFSDITSAGTKSESDNDSGATNKAKSSEGSNIKTLARSLRSVALRSTHHAYGAPKTPTLSSITPILNQCPSLESLEISYVPPKLNSNPTRPSVDELFLITRFPNLTHLYLNDLRYTVPSASSLTTFLSSHANIRVMHLDVNGPGLAVTNQGTGFTLPENTLPVLQEIKAPKSIISAVLTCPMLPTDDSQSPFIARPLATIKNIRLTNLSSQYESVFLQNLRAHAHSIRHLEISHFVDIDDIRRVCINLPGLTWLDLGLRDGRGDGGATRRPNVKATGSTHSGTMANLVPVVNTMEWADALSNAPELHTVHGVRFFYEVSLPTSASTSAASLADRSRIRKNDEIASILAWKCPKLRRVDHWETIGGTARAGSKATNGVESSLREKDRKVIVLLRENEKVRWEVRKVKA